VSNSKFADFNLDPALAEAVAAAADHEFIEGVLKLDDPKLIPPQFERVSQFIRICTGRFRAADTWSIRRHPNVVSLKAARPLGISHLSEAPSANRESARRTVHRTSSFTGRGSVCAMLDFGLDVGHVNFLNSDGSTRVKALWHQRAHYDPARRNRYGYGRIFSRQEINAALLESDPYRALGYHPSISDSGHGSHGTHTTDIAAGNGRAPGSQRGIAPEAEILFVHLSTPRSAPGANLGDSVRMLEALDFVHRSAGSLPCAINLSVGRTAGSHDGTSPFEQGMHELLDLSPGRAIAQSAGNYRLAHLATHGLLREGEEREVQWAINPQDTKPTEIDAWYSGNDRFRVRVRAPNGHDWVKVALGEVVDIKSDEGALIGRLYHRKKDPSNNDNNVDLFLYPNAPAGTWRLRLLGEYVINGHFHAWIERETSRSGNQARFDAAIASPSYTLGTIATSPLVLTVGALDSHSVGAPLASFSSCGPTRDGRRDKPELLAPGVQILAARSIPEGAEKQESLLVELSGTSMAAPHLTGTIAVMFEAAGRPLYIDEIRDCLKMSAEPPLEVRNADCYGWGRLNSTAAIAAAGKLREIPHMNVSSVIDAGPLDAGEFLDRAEQAVRSSYGVRQESEITFLEWLLRTVGIQVLSECSPATLYRAVSNGGPRADRGRLPFELIAAAAKPFDGPFRIGDLMIRRIPGIGDIGHVSILASGDLLEVSDLKAAGIGSESGQPGRYGIVIEAGAYPHTRSEPFARRLLDSRGRVLPHTVFLRTDYSAVHPVRGAPLYGRDTGATTLTDDAPGADQKPAPANSTQPPPASGPLDIDPAESDADNDIVLIICAIEKPGDVAQYWHDNVKPNPTHWAEPLSDLEQSYLDAMTDSGVPEALRMRSPVNPGKLTADEAGEAKKIFGATAEDASRYANYENRRRILAHYVTTHPATVRLELGLYRLIRDINPLHFALERGWQIGSGKEMFTELEVSRLGAAFEFVASLTIVYGIGKVIQAFRPITGTRLPAPRSLEDPIGDLPPDGGGMLINGRWYTEHALERMAPDTPQVREQIRARVLARLERIGINSKFPAYDRILARALKKINPRGVPPSRVEAEILRRGSTNVRVITAKRGSVIITVIPRKGVVVKPAAAVSESMEIQQQMSDWLPVQAAAPVVAPRSRSSGEYRPSDQLEPGALMRARLSEPYWDDGAPEERFEPSTIPRDVADVLSAKNWLRALQLAIRSGWHDENDLTDLIFYARHPELASVVLDPRDSKFKQQSAEWSTVLKREVRPAIEQASDNTALVVSGKYVAERDSQFWGASGAKFRDLVEWAASEVDINPGLLGAVLLAEWDQNSLYLSPGVVRSFQSGTDDFFESRAQLAATVPAFSKVHFDLAGKTTNTNEHGRVVTTIPFKTGKDAALATAVYLKYAEIKLRKGAKSNGGDFDTFSAETKFALVRIAMAAGHGGIDSDGTLIRFKKKHGNWSPVAKGERGGILVGVASRLERVLAGDDILIRKDEPRQDPSQSGHVTERNATILAAQALHLSDWIFGKPPVTAIQPPARETEDWDERRQTDCLTINPSIAVVVDAATKGREAKAETTNSESNAEAVDIESIVDGETGSQAAGGTLRFELENEIAALVEKAAEADAGAGAVLYWTNPTKEREVLIDPPEKKDEKDLGFFGFAFTPMGTTGWSGTITGKRSAWRHKGAYTLKANEPGRFEMDVNIGNDDARKNDLNVKLKIENRVATVIGTYGEGTDNETKTAPEGDRGTLTGEGTKANPFLIKFRDSALQWF
jgi:subtilisin family serine protease